MTDNKFVVKFDRGFLEARTNLKREVFKINLKRFFYKLLGIYDVFDAKILTEPKQEGDVWSYKIKILKVRKYFLWINYANRSWNKSN